MTPEPFFATETARAQQVLASTPYDRWLTPAGDVAAEFHRSDRGYLLRFPDQADFAIADGLEAITCFPTPDTDERTIASLYANSVRPVVGNHAGEFNLHGSAVMIGGKALAIMGFSRRGKTTLAGALAKAGHPFLTEDVLALTPDGSNYSVAPQRPVLRVFDDTAAYLSGEVASARGEKSELAESADVPAAKDAAPLGAICLLGQGDVEQVTISRCDPAVALAEIMQHSFVLDVEDRARLSAHFERLAALANAVPCHHLDYPRDFARLPAVVTAIAEQFGG
ncbi:hypothetical protein [Aurantiacibacter sp. MUD61]|uniref:hypothetical protein n=1 Tax=Aurantiacibacter sp. MUD61 TaxID=3009083 RepID=UPI0022F0705C|nr:hypothetical protein [Aurantiacibacter sp. MUD61]